MAKFHGLATSLAPASQPIAIFANGADKVTSRDCFSAVPVSLRQPSNSRKRRKASNSLLDGKSSSIRIALIILVSIRENPRASVQKKLLLLQSDFLLALKPRRPLLQKRRRPFLLILSGAANSKQ